MQKLLVPNSSMALLDSCWSQSGHVLRSVGDGAEVHQLCTACRQPYSSTWKKKLGITKPPEEASVLPSKLAPRRFFTKMNLDCGVQGQERLMDRSLLELLPSSRTAVMVERVPNTPTRMPRPKLSTPTCSIRTETLLRRKGPSRKLKLALQLGHRVQVSVDGRRRHWSNDQRLSRLSPAGECAWQGTTRWRSQQ